MIGGDDINLFGLLELLTPLQLPAVSAVNAIPTTSFYQDTTSIILFRSSETPNK
jgi:hypothetical protein